MASNASGFMRAGNALRRAASWRNHGRTNTQHVLGTTRAEGTQAVTGGDEAFSTESNIDFCGSDRVMVQDLERFGGGGGGFRVRDSLTCLRVQDFEIYRAHQFARTKKQTSCACVLTSLPGDGETENSVRLHCNVERKS